MHYRCVKCRVAPRQQKTSVPTKVDIDIQLSIAILPIIGCRYPIFSCKRPAVNHKHHVVGPGDDHMGLKTVTSLVTIMGLCGGVSAVALTQEFEQEPIRYSQSQPDNRVSRLIERVNAGQTKLVHEEHFGFLQSLLSEL